MANVDMNLFIGDLCNKTANSSDIAMWKGWLMGYE
jgi:hypothetical protein